MSEQYYTIEQHPASLSKKVKLLYRFKDSMNHERLVKAGAKHAKSDGDSLARYPYMLQFHPIPQCILMHLSNGTIQVISFSARLQVSSLLVYWQQHEVKCLLLFFNKHFASSLFIMNYIDLT
jgi:hypothetical protein